MDFHHLSSKEISNSCQRLVPGPIRSNRVEDVYGENLLCIFHTGPLKGKYTVENLYRRLSLG